MKTSSKARFKSLDVSDFARLFGTSAADLNTECRRLIQAGNFRYQVLSTAERERVLLDVLKRIDSGTLSVAGKAAKARWEKGWSENLDGFLKNGGDLSRLVPKYIRPRQPVRLDQDYVLPQDDQFELNWYAIFRSWLFNKYLKNTRSVYEFGCGSGFNLAALAKLFPDKKLVGLDWVKASSDIVNEMAKANHWNLSGRVFDFFSPDRQLKMEPESTVLTIGALEQTGTGYEAFLQFLLKAKPALCVHVEPVLEWYDENNLVDYAAIRFHRVRGYWQGFPSRLRQLETQGKIKIIKMKRSFFGSLFIEGYSQIIWKPIW